MAFLEHAANFRQDFKPMLAHAGQLTVKSYIWGSRLLHLHSIAMPLNAIARAVENC